jgi:nitrogen fixation protein FixH
MRKLLLALSLGALSFGAITLMAQSKPNWKIAYEVPKTAKANYDTPLTVKITDAKGKPVGGATVETVLTMVEMDHGEFKEPAKEVKPGVYEAKQKFIMVGAWQIEVRAKKGAESASQKFRFDLKE